MTMTMTIMNENSPSFESLLNEMDLKWESKPELGFFRYKISGKLWVAALFKTKWYAFLATVEAITTSPHLEKRRKELFAA